MLFNVALGFSAEHSESTNRGRDARAPIQRNLESNIRMSDKTMLTIIEVVMGK